MAGVSTGLPRERGNALRPTTPLQAASKLAIRKRRVDKQKARDAADVQVRRERQASQAVVTTCAYILAVVDAARRPVVGGRGGSDKTASSAAGTPSTSQRPSSPPTVSQALKRLAPQTSAPRVSEAIA